MAQTGGVGEAYLVLGRVRLGEAVIVVDRSKDWPGHAAGQLRVLLLMVVGGFAIVIAGRDLAWLYPLMFAAGLACAPAAAALTTSFSMAGTTATRAASFAWLASSSSLGGSAGYATAGLLLTRTTITITILIGAALPIAAATTVPQRTRRPGKPLGPDPAIQPTAPG